MQNFLNYIRLEGEQKFNILVELKEVKFKKKSTLLYNLFDIHFFKVVTLYKHTDY